MTKVMITIQTTGGSPTLTELMERYQLTGDDIDTEFGVVEIDPQDQLYVILVEPDAASRIESNEQWETSGPFSNPRIAPFGPPEAPSESTSSDKPSAAECSQEGRSGQGCNR